MRNCIIKPLVFFCRRFVNFHKLTIRRVTQGARLLRNSVVAKTVTATDNDLAYVVLLQSKAYYEYTKT